ncbi:MAG: hypothetical protein RJA49_1682 [Actinomycetota bacterium]|jgi:hypothetical protein
MTAAFVLFLSWVAYLTGGAGALLFVAATGTALWWWRSRGRDTARLRPLVVGFALGLVVWNGVSLAKYAIPDTGDQVSARIAEWGRDHGMGPVIDRVETAVYSKPPSVHPALSLDLATTTTTPTTAATGSTAVTMTTDPGAPTTVASATVRPPAALVPVFSPPLPGEGQWTPVARADGMDTMWATSVRPLRAYGGVVATMVAIDQTHVRAALFNGRVEPGGTWARGDRVPAALQPMLLATMNGGFRFKHIKGGYKTEGRVAKPLRVGDATLAVGRDGRLTMGRLGRDLRDDGSWVSLRQNLELIVDGSRSNVAQGIRDGVWWGANFGNKVYVKRSAVCAMSDGRLAYVLADPVDASQLADALVALGCTTAMQLDINGQWPSFVTYGHPTTGITAHSVDTRMTGNPRRFLDGSSKEFFAFFDATSVPAGSVLDR